MINSFFRLFLCVVFSGSTASALTCGEILIDNSQTVVINLPGKGNSFTKRVFDNLSEKNQKLLEVLDAALVALNRGSVQALLLELNQPIPENLNQVEIPQFLVDFMHGKPTEKVAYNNYRYFKTFLSAEFSDDTVIGLSILFSGVSRRNRASAGFLSESLGLSAMSDAAQKKMVRSIEELVNQPPYAQAILELLKSEYLASKITAELKRVNAALLDRYASEIQTRNSIELDAASEEGYKNMIAGHLDKHSSTDVSAIEAYYSRNGKFKKAHAAFVIEALVVLVGLHMEYIEENPPAKQGVVSRILGAGKPVAISEMDRGDRIHLLEEYLVAQVGSRSNIESIAVLLDHLMHVSAIPLTSKQLEALVDQSLKTSLVGAKGERSQMRTERHLQNRELPVATSFTLKPEDNAVSVEVSQAPVLNPNKRRNNRRGARRETVTPVVQKSVEMIPPEEDLFRFAHVADEARQISDLEEGVRYKVRFLREGDDSSIKTVEFDKGVIKSFNANPELAGQLILAFSMGMAARDHQDGLKILKDNNIGREGRIYELKTRKSTARVLVRHIDGHWVFLKVTDKQSMDRVLRTIN